MDQEKPKNIDEYKTWLQKQQRVEITARTKTYYESVTNSALRTIQGSQFWADLRGNLREIGDTYLLRTGYLLFTSSDQPALLTKSFDSVVSKSFRKNVIANRNWPNPPQAGWILPENWFTRVGDLVRTLLVVKYLDGVRFLVERIEKIAQTTAAPCKCFFEARDEGYYAAHVYVSQKCEVPSIAWDTELIDMRLEIQVTTQLQEVIRRLLHGYYETARESKKSDMPWQWNFDKDEFFANNLGHILHYVEGMIVDVRKRQKESSK
jgi:hypothetical protein